jgi:hypothetical protein
MGEMLVVMDALDGGVVFCWCFLGEGQRRVLLAA